MYRIQTKGLGIRSLEHASSKMQKTMFLITQVPTLCKGCSASAIAALASLILCKSGRSGHKKSWRASTEEASCRAAERGTNFHSIRGAGQFHAQIMFLQHCDVACPRLCDGAGQLHRKMITAASRSWEGHSSPACGTVLRHGVFIKLRLPRMTREKKVHSSQL